MKQKPIYDFQWTFYSTKSYRQNNTLLIDTHFVNPHTLLKICHLLQVGIKNY